MTQSPLTVRRWKRAEYDRLVQLGAFDRDVKGSLYARAGIQDYGILNLVDRVLEVYRDPVPDAAAPYAWRYQTVTVAIPPAVVTPLAFSAMRIAVADLLP